MALPPDEAVASVIDTALASLTLGTNLFQGPVRPPSSSVPHKAVFCLATGGPAPLMHTQGNNGPDVKRASVQVRIRGDVNSFAAGQTLARSVWTALQRATFAGYMSIACRESEPVYLGVDNTEHHEWSVNVETWREE
jgi:hypothetical protein